MIVSEYLENLIKNFAKLPGVGKKTARRYAYAILNMPHEDVYEISDAIKNAKDKIKHCKLCGNYTEDEICEICRERDNSVICVVSHPNDLIAIEQTGMYRGVYHILFGLIDPLKGILPKDIKIKELIDRVEQGNVKEIIMATVATHEGNATLAYIRSMLENKDVKITRLAQGISIGTDIEYADASTLTQALHERREI